jgi:chemotaxis protein histidine kinase CheA
MQAEGYIPNEDELGPDGFLVVAPPRRLQSKSLKRGLGVSGANDAIKRAEQALVELSPNFASWAQAECRELCAARDAAKSADYAPAACDTLFRKAHDLKGQAGTFGYPVAADICASLCRLIDGGLDDSGMRRLADCHVDAIRALIAAGMTGDNEEARAMCSALDAAARRLLARRAPSPL